MMNPDEAAKQLELSVQALLETEFTQADLEAIGQQAVNVMVLRTKQGKDVNHHDFAPYSDAYKEERAAAGLSTQPDLVRTGHMQQALTAVPGQNEVTIKYLNPNEERKASYHNSGVDSDVYVNAHRRSTFVNAKTGRRVSAVEVKRDKKRKKSRLKTREENVSSFKRRQRLPKREHFGIEHPSDIAVVAAAIERVIEDKLK